ncbi:type VI secretion system-associated FHA domain protein TagH [Marinobacter arenosus]|uniref:type VI secretion system-associated FHA domain protein TagH n=1 Tax=Marinobacter arenosus TaxID=2856822 RepID=UPI001C4BEA4A|nr:type VI secretion system-associated FHA domain protein TagH [Marinobacter arenosus]MBW0147855.1 type VI secretion system-associated FHA domain protein TagH [Marinobacter arenosus]
MNTRPSMLLKLTLTNPAETGSGAIIEHCFDVSGGSIGTAANDTWQLSPHRTGVVAGHAEIRFMDGGFCLIDRSGRTFINSSSQPLGRGRRARLEHGDTVKVGRYHLRAELAAGDRSHHGADPEPEHDQLVNGDVVEPDKVSVHEKEAAVEGKEPLEGLDPAIGMDDTNDPLNPWRRELAGEQGTELSLMADDPTWVAGAAAVTDEYRENRDVAMGLPIRTSGRDRMPDSRSVAGYHRNSDTSRKHISGAPLMRGMETELEFVSSDEMQLFMEEAGQTLKATVEGLLALHQCEDSRHQALRTRLQPIEDNPLRLGADYQDTVQTLFASQRSPVHLSAPAAIRESLESLNHHQLATQSAIREALAAILHAFSPDALLRRFHGYRRGLGQSEDEGRWAWDMYQNYYRELKSSRQQGFERLFQEVFDQAYDQHLRQLQREDLL